MTASYNSEQELLYQDDPEEGGEEQELLDQDDPEEGGEEQELLDQDDPEYIPPAAAAACLRGSKVSRISFSVSWLD